MDQVLYGIDYIEYYFYWIYYKFIGYPLIIRICSIAVMFCIIAYLFLLFHIIYGIFKRRKEKRKYNKAFDKYYEEMKYEEMSSILNTSVGALKASYHHAVKKICDFFKSQD